MLNWKKWCRLCGAFENNQEVDPDIEEVLIHIFEVSSTGSYICLNCELYVRDFQSFLSKARSINQMFEDLAQKEESREDEEIDDVLLLQTRLTFNLPLPDIEQTEDSEMDKDIAEVENYKIEEGSLDLDNGTEFIFESEEFEPLKSEVQDENSSHQYLSENEKSFDEDIMEYDEEIEYMIDEEKNVITYEEVTRQEEPKEDEVVQETLDETDEISQHFEFRCHICNTNFHKMCFLTIHTKTIHNCVPRVLCSCGKYLGTVRTVISHYESHIKNTSNYKCDQCIKFYKTETHYQNHMQTVHGDSDGDARKFKCDCGKAFKEARHLAVHTNSHLPDEKKFIHTCSYCQKNYSSVFSLRQHIKHVHENVPTFKCQHCSKMFSRKANLDSHLSHVHTAVRNYECDICGLRVKTKGILRMHKKIHSTNPDDLLTCDVCQRQFKTQNQLTNHKVCHSTVKKYKCLHCPAEYKRSKELGCHIATAHTGESKYLCQWCTKTFYNNSNYRKHKLRMHPEQLEMERNLDDGLSFDTHDD